jgi:FkbM family methyltransferase
VKNPLIKRLSRHLRGSLRARVLSRHGVAVIADTRNGLLAVQPGDFNVSRSLLTKGEYDWVTIQWLRRLLPQGAHLIFAGAHIGSVLVPLARDCGGCEVLAFEPSPSNFRLLGLNLTLNALERIKIFNLALADVAGHLKFTENAINSGNSRLGESGEISVEVSTLDAAVPAGWQVDLIVMDVEGSEVRVMKGGGEVLSRTRYLYTEFAPEQLREQVSNTAEFVTAATAHFASAYVFEHTVRFLRRNEIGPFLEGRDHTPGFLTNLLFTREQNANPDLLHA